MQLLMYQASCSTVKKACDVLLSAEAEYKITLWLSLCKSACVNKSWKGASKTKIVCLFGRYMGDCFYFPFFSLF